MKQNQVFILEWILKRLEKRGFLHSETDRIDFVNETGVGKTKFNKWMKFAGLIFDKKRGHWIVPLHTTKEKLINSTKEAISTSKLNTKTITIDESELNSKDNLTFAPSENDGWPILNDDGSKQMVFGKYTNDEIFQLAQINAGIGFTSFVVALFDGGRSSTVYIRIKDLFEQQFADTGVDYYKIIQGTSVDEPSDFNWNGLTPGYLRKTDKSRTTMGLKNASFKSLWFDYRQMWALCQDGYTFGEISRSMEIPYPSVINWNGDFENWDNSAVLTSWFELADLLKSFSIQRGHSSVAEERTDDLIVFLRMVTRDYINSPELWTSRPKLAELNDVFVEMTSEDSNSNEQINEDYNSRIGLFSNQFDYQKNFRMTAMINGSFFDPLIEAGRIQVNNNATGFIVHFDKNQSHSKATDFINCIMNEFNLPIYLKSTDHKLIQECITKVNVNQLMILTSDSSIVECFSHVEHLTFVCSCPIDYSDYETQYLFLDTMFDMCIKSKIAKERIFIEPILRPFFPNLSPDFSNLGAGEFLETSARDYLGLIKKIALKHKHILCNCESMGVGISSADNAQEKIIRVGEYLCIEFGASNLIINPILHSEIAPSTDDFMSKMAHDTLLNRNLEFFDKYSSIYRRLTSD